LMLVFSRRSHVLRLIRLGGLMFEYIQKFLVTISQHDRGRENE